MARLRRSGRSPSLPPGIGWEGERKKPKTGVIDVAAATGVLAHTAARLDDFLARQPADGPSLADAHESMKEYQCAKWTVNQGDMQVVSRAMDVVGGGAYASASPLGRLYRDVRAGPFMQPFSPTETHEYIGQIGFGLYPEG